MTDESQPAHVVSDTYKFDKGLSWLLHTELHCRDVPEKVKYKFSLIRFTCYGRRTIRIPLLFLGFGRFVYHVRRGAGSWAELIM